MSLGVHLALVAVVIAACALLVAVVQGLRGRGEEARQAAIVGAFGLFCAALGYGIAA